MIADDSPAYCARCLSQLRHIEFEDVTCRNCGTSIESGDDWLDAVQLETMRRSADREMAAWNRAMAEEEARRRIGNACA